MTFDNKSDITVLDGGISGPSFKTMLACLMDLIHYGDFADLKDEDEESADKQISYYTER